MTDTRQEVLKEAAVEDDPRPVVALPRPGLPGGVIAGLAVIAALILFAVLDGQRRRGADMSLRAERVGADAFTPPPPLMVPREPEPTPVVSVVTTPLPPPPVLVRPEPSPRQGPPAYIPPTIVPMPVAPAALPPLQAERRTTGTGAPALVFDGGDQQAAGGSPAQIRPSPSGGPGASGGADETPARATRIGNQTTVMPVGTVIPAVLETPIDTARPGLLRAVVSQDARGFDGRRVLVPKGSRLIGEYQADVRPNQKRVLVTWTRLIRPDGVAIRLGSPASDPLGGAGVPGRLHTYFFERFASAVLQSALTVGVNLASRPGNGSVIVGLPGTTVNNVVGQSGLLPGNTLQPKITVKQGAALNVFVARDLDFSGVPSLP